MAIDLTEGLTTTRKMAPISKEEGLAMEREYDRERYERSQNLIGVAEALISYYKSIGIRPCDVPHLHAIIRASFGYGV